MRAAGGGGKGDLGAGPRGIPRTSAGRSGLSLGIGVPARPAQPAPGGVHPGPGPVVRLEAGRSLPFWGPGMSRPRESGSWALRPQTPGED